MKPTLTIEVFFDLVCPWCLIGKRHLDTVLAQLVRIEPEVEVNVVWQSHVLLPDTPQSGLPYQAFYLQRLGSHEAVAMRRAQVQAAGRAAGLEFAFEQISVLPNTLAAHRLIQYAGQLGGTQLQTQLIERLFQGFFQRGQDIGDTAVLTRLASKCGIEQQAAAAYLASAEGLGALRKAEQHAQRHGISGVPGFVFDNRLQLSGAVPPDTLLKAMQQSLRSACRITEQSTIGVKS